MKQVSLTATARNEHHVFSDLGLCNFQDLWCNPIPSACHSILGGILRSLVETFDVSGGARRELRHPEQNNYKQDKLTSVLRYNECSFSPAELTNGAWLSPEALISRGERLLVCLSL